MLKSEVFFERVLKALFKDIALCYLPSMDDEPVVEDMTSPSSDDEYPMERMKETLNADIFLTYKGWTNDMIDRVRTTFLICVTASSRSF